MSRSKHLGNAPPSRRVTNLGGRTTPAPSSDHAAQLYFLGEIFLTALVKLGVKEMVLLPDDHRATKGLNLTTIMDGEKIILKILGDEDQKTLAKATGEGGRYRRLL